MGEMSEFPSDPGKEVVVPVDPLRSLISSIFEKEGAYGYEADIAADRLIEADLWGIPSHGCRTVTAYVDAIDCGDIDPRAEVISLTETPAMAVWDAGEGLGQVAATKAMQLAIAKAKDVGTGTVAVKRSRHFGAAGTYVQLAIDEGMIGFCTTNTAGPTVAAYGSRQRGTANNAIAWGIPTRSGAPLILDMACAAASWGKVRTRALYGLPIPPGWALDSDGHETVDPNAAAALLPMAGPRGFGLALVCSVLAGPLAGGKMPTQKKQHYLTEPSEHFFYAIDIKQFGDPDQFFDTLDATVTDMHALEPSEGFDKVRLPGEREWERAQCRRSDGVPLHKDTVSALTELASRMSLELPW